MRNYTKYALVDDGEYAALLFAVVAGDEIEVVARGHGVARITRQIPPSGSVWRLERFDPMRRHGENLHGAVGRHVVERNFLPGMPVHTPGIRIDARLREVFKSRERRWRHWVARKPRTARRAAGRAGIKDHVHPIITRLRALRREGRRRAVKIKPVQTIRAAHESVQGSIVDTSRGEVIGGDRVAGRREIGDDVGRVGRDRYRRRKIHRLPARRGFSREGHARQQRARIRPEMPRMRAGIKDLFIETNGCNVAASIRSKADAGFQCRRIFPPIA
jgi:hypothetical protein